MLTCKMHIATEDWNDHKFLLFIYLFEVTLSSDEVIMELLGFSSQDI